MDRGSAPAAIFADGLTGPRYGGAGNPGETLEAAARLRERLENEERAGSMLRGEGMQDRSFVSQS
jgi:hypothetical protein